MNISDDAIVALMHSSGIDAIDIARRKTFLSFGDADARLLTELRACWPDVSRFVEGFYAHLTGTDEIRGFIPDDATLARLKQAQSAYFDRLTAGDYGPEYILERLRVGLVHRRIGLDPKWYLGAYSQYLVRLLPELWSRLGNDPARFLATYAALEKIVFLDLGLALDACVHADRQAIVGLRRYAEDIVASLPHGLVVLDSSLEVLSGNDAIYPLLGLANSEPLSGRNIDDCLPVAGLRQQVRAVLDGHALSRSIVGALGQKWLRITIAGIRLVEEQDDEEERLMLLVEDITEQQIDAVRIEQLAFHDSLTGLPNRTMFADCLDRALSRSDHFGEPLTLVYMDLDRFKEINDTAGHAVGNLVLIEVAKRLQASVNKNETLARMGGDEFVLLAKGADRAAARLIAKRLLNALAGPVMEMERPFSVELSIGVAVYPDDGITADDLHKRADIAMYQAKATRSGYCIYRPEMSAGIAERMQLAQDLSHAISASELQLYYQPQVNLRTGALVGAEALLRWHNPERGWVSPAEFIPLAEERHMMGTLGTWQDPVHRRRCGTRASPAGNRADRKRAHEEHRGIHPDHGDAEARGHHHCTRRLRHRPFIIGLSAASAGRQAENRYLVCAGNACGKELAHDRSHYCQHGAKLRHHGTG